MILWRLAILLPCWSFGDEFPDPDPEMTVDQVKGTLADFYGEIANASVKETKRGEDTIYEFQRRVGTKGASTR